MDKVLKNITDLTQYSNLTKAYTLNREAQKANLNLSTILALKKVRSFEIEFFRKYEGVGIAVTLFDELLRIPPSKTWGLLGKELIFLLKFWLDEIRNQLINTSLNWWVFLKTLLKFVKVIKQKHVSFPNMLVQDTAECLLDLASNCKVDVLQKFEIILCFNLYCAESSRDVRVAMKIRLDEYLIKLAQIMASCGHFPTQHSILEALLRWTIGRQDLDVRKRAAAKLLPSNLYYNKAINLFIERKWTDFFQDARDFLNLHNSVGSGITSVLCRKLLIGKLVIVSGSEKKPVWLDLNSTTKCVTIFLEPRYLPMLSPDSDSCYETLTITGGNTSDVQISRKSQDVKITILTKESLELTPSLVKVNQTDKNVTIFVSNVSDFKNIDGAFKSIFGDVSYKNEEFSHPSDVQLGRRSGYIVRPRYDPLRSPSTVSTSSLAQLHEKLEGLPRLNFDKEPVSVCAHPELSNVTEVTEPEERSSANTSTSTFRSRPCGVFSKSFRNINEEKERRSQSDSEIRKPDKKRDKCISPAIHDENSISCLLVATIGSEESIINDTLDRLPKDKAFTTDNIVDLLVQEALEAQGNKTDNNCDSGIAGDKRTQDLNEINSDFVENTPYLDVNLNLPRLNKSNCPDNKYSVVNNSSSSNESNTEELIEEPDIQVNYVSTRRKPCPSVNDNQEENNIFDDKIAETFFSQHFSENPVAERVISPTLAKKINESSSFTSDTFDKNILQTSEIEKESFPLQNDEEVINCLNNLIDEVCDNLQKCTEYLDQDPNEKVIKKIAHELAPVEGDSQEKMKNDDAKITKVKITKKRQPAKRNLKLKYVVAPKTERNTKAKAKKPKNKLELAGPTKMSTIDEVDDEVIETEASSKPSSPAKNKNSSKSTTTDSETPLLKRKRKLYSPKQDEDNIGTEVKKTKVTTPLTYEVQENKMEPTMPETSKTPLLNPIATPYKEIEKERRKIRKPRTRKNKITDTPPSPRTVNKNQVFDKLKDNLENGESIIVAEKNKDVAVYNFTSDSEDEDFKKKSELPKRTSTTTIASFDSTTSTKRGRKVTKINYKEKKSDSATDDNSKPKTRPKRSKRINSKTKIAQTITKDLIDEKMRGGLTEKLNTSFEIQNATDEAKNLPLEPMVKLVQMECLTVEDENNDPPARVISTRSKKIPKNLSIKVEKASKTQTVETISNTGVKSVSPLPDLVVEAVENIVEIVDADESITPNMLQRFKQIYNDSRDVDPNNTNTTHMSLDNEDISYSPENNVTNELNKGLSNIIEIEDLTNFTGDSNKENMPVKKNKRKEKNNKNSKLGSRANKTDITHITLDSQDLSDGDNVSIGSEANLPITGHGDSDESPPRPELLDATIVPRNLELIDMDQSMANYFLKLTREANESPENYHSCDERKSTSSIKEGNGKSTDDKDSHSTNKSPILNLRVLGEVHKWLPSPRSSDSEDDGPEKEITVLETLSFNTEKTKKIFRHKVSTIDVIRKDTSTSDASTVVNVVKDTERTPERYKQEDSKNYNTAKKPKISSPIIQTRKNTISPIKLSFDNLILETSSNKSHSETAVALTKSTSRERSDKTKQITDIPSTKRYNLRKSPKGTYKVATKFTLDSPVAKNERKTVPVKYEDNVSPNKRLTKRRDVEDRHCASGPSVSSVNEWFQNMESSNEVSEENGALSCYEEVIDTVIEKLDTTLGEIHHSTSKNFIGLFVEAQKQLQHQKLERQKLYKETAREIMKNVVKVIDDKFADLERKSQEMEQQFMQNLKQGSCKMVREDNKQKRLMVHILKEDIQAVVNHIAKKKTK